MSFGLSLLRRNANCACSLCTARFRLLRASIIATGLFLLAAVAVKSSLAADDSQPNSSLDSYESRVQPFVRKYCSECHQGTMPEAGILFEKYVDEKSMLKDRRTWERTFKIVTQGSMPPADSAQPSADEKTKLLDYLHEKLFHIDCTKVSDPGRVTIRRLNRAEYNNTVRDLIGVDFRPAEDFPTDDVGYGFDSIGDVLSLPPLLMEKYLNAAEKISQAALITIDPTKPSIQEYNRDQLHRSSVAHPLREDLVILVSNGDIFVEYQFPRSGQYILKVSAGEQPAGEQHSTMEFRLDDKPVAKFEVTPVDPQSDVYEFPIHVDRGFHKFSIAFLNDFFNETAEDKNRRDRNLVVRDLQIVGPTEIDATEFPEFHHAFLNTVPGPERTLAEAAR